MPKIEPSRSQKKGYYADWLRLSPKVHGRHVHCIGRSRQISVGMFFQRESFDLMAEVVKIIIFYFVYAACLILFIGYKLDQLGKFGR